MCIRDSSRRHRRKHGFLPSELLPVLRDLFAFSHLFLPRRFAGLPRGEGREIRLARDVAAVYDGRLRRVGDEDVYKRQVHNRPAREVARQPQRERVVDVQQRYLLGRGPVSYTHLDVYKRQFYCRARDSASQY